MSRTHKAFALACIFCGALLQPVEAQIGQYHPSGCPGTWRNGACVCPDGSLAYGYPNITCGGGGGEGADENEYEFDGPPQVQYCPNGGTCQVGQTCCGNMCCGSGSQCSSAGCISADADDCGGGHYCSGGHVCWRAPEDVAGIKRGETKCPTPEDRDQLERLVEQQRSQRQEKKERDAEEKKHQEQEKKDAAQRAQEEKQRAIVEQKTTAQSTRLSDEQLKTNLEASKQRMQELTRQAQSQQSVVPPLPADWARQQLEAYARGEGTLSEPTASSQQAPSLGPANSIAPPLNPNIAGNAAALRPYQQEQRTIDAPTISRPSFSQPSVTGFDGPPVTDPTLRQRIEKQAEDARRTETDRIAAQAAADEAYAKARGQQLQEERKRSAVATAQRAQQSADALTKKTYPCHCKWGPNAACHKGTGAFGTLCMTCTEIDWWPDRSDNTYTCQ